MAPTLTTIGSNHGTPARRGEHLARVPDEGRLRERHGRHQRGQPDRRRRPQRRRQVDPAAAAGGAAAARLGPGHAPRRRDARDARPVRRAGDRAHRRRDRGRRPAGARVGGRRARARRDRGVGRRHPVDRPRRRPERRPAPAGRARGPAHPRLGRRLPRRAHQPPRRRGGGLARPAPEEALAGEPGRTRGRHPRPVVPRRGLDRHLGGARHDHRALRGRIRGVHPAARRTRPHGRGQRVEAAEPAAQRAGLAAARGSCPVDEAQVPDGCRCRPDRRRAADPRLGVARAAGRESARQGRRRPARRLRDLRRGGARRRPRLAPGAARHRVAHRAGGAHRHPRGERRGQVDAARAGGRNDQADHRASSNAARR